LRFQLSFYSTHSEVPVAIASKALGAEDFDTVYNECVLQNAIELVVLSFHSGTGYDAIAMGYDSAGA
jgi:hypothetical protein